MKRLMDLYDSIRNPLDDLDTIKTIIEAYSDSKKNNRSFYHTLLEWNSREKQIAGGYNPYIEDVISFWKFNKWKDNIINMTPEKYAKIYGDTNGFYSTEFNILQSFLKQIDATISQKNFEEFKNEMKNNPRLRNAYEKYDYEINQSGWDYVSSAHLLEGELINVQHRLYINCDSVSKYNVITKIIDNFSENNIPIHFKYNDADRDDTIVLWTDDKNLLNTVNMLISIKERLPKNACYTPPVLSGIIDGWLGYGSEPTTLLNGEQTSFNRIRTEAIRLAINNVYTKYISSHVNASVLSEFEIAERNPSFIQAIRNEIIRISKQYGIDENNFCFDTKTIEKMRQTDIESEQTIQQQSLNSSTDEVAELADEALQKHSIAWEELLVSPNNRQSNAESSSINTEDEPDLEALLLELNQIEKNDEKRKTQHKAPKQVGWRKKFDRRDKDYYKKAEEYLLGELKRLTPEQRKRGNQYLEVLEQEQYLSKGDN